MCTQFSMETRPSLFTSVYHIVGKTGMEFKLAVWWLVLHSTTNLEVKSVTSILKIASDNHVLLKL